MQPALQDEPRRSRGVLGPSLADNRPKTGPKNTRQAAFRYPDSGFCCRGRLCISRLKGSILTFRPPRAGVRASICYGAPFDLAAAVFVRGLGVDASGQAGRLTEHAGEKHGNRTFKIGVKNPLTPSSY